MDQKLYRMHGIQSQEKDKCERSLRDMKDRMGIGCIYWIGVPYGKGREERGKICKDKNARILNW